MKILVLAAAVLGCSVLSSCSKYQYVAFQSNIPSQEKGMVIENDTVKITYTFKGRNCPIHIEVSNKLSQPIFIDWKKSALILGEERFSYWQDKTSLNAQTSGYEINWNKSSSQRSSTTGELIRDEQVSFIPPHSFVKVDPYTVKDSFFDLPRPTKDQKVVVSKGETPITGAKYVFNKASSPLKFRSYLTLSAEESFSSSFHFDNEFWVNEIIATGASPDELANQPVNQFSMKKNTGFGNVLTAIIAIPLLIILSLGGTHSK